MEPALAQPWRLFEIVPAKKLIDPSPPPFVLQVFLCCHENESSLGHVLLFTCRSVWLFRRPPTENSPQKKGPLQGIIPPLPSLSPPPASLVRPLFESCLVALGLLTRSFPGRTVECLFSCQLMSWIYSAPLLTLIQLFTYRFHGCKASSGDGRIKLAVRTNPAAPVALSPFTEHPP